jgi:hypothetical protein
MDVGVFTITFEHVHPTEYNKMGFQFTPWDWYIRYLKKILNAVGKYFTFINGILKNMRNLMYIL